MKKIPFAFFFVTFFYFLSAGFSFEKTLSKNADFPADTSYVCLPCGGSCDAALYNQPGICSHCNMMLVEKSSIKFNTVEPGDLCSLIDKKGSSNVLLLDVRTTEEFNGTSEEKFGRLKNAVNIPVQQLQARIKELEKYKRKEIIVYCSHSHRSPQASYLLNQNGFMKVTNMQGGMSVWKEKGIKKRCNNKLYIAQ